MEGLTQEKQQLISLYDIWLVRQNMTNAPQQPWQPYKLPQQHSGAAPQQYNGAAQQQSQQQQQAIALHPTSMLVADTMADTTAGTMAMAVEANVMWNTVLCLAVRQSACLFLCTSLHICASAQ